MIEGNQTANAIETVGRGNRKHNVALRHAVFGFSFGLLFLVGSTCFFLISQGKPLTLQNMISQLTHSPLILAINVALPLLLSLLAFLAGRNQDRLTHLILELRQETTHLETLQTNLKQLVEERTEDIEQRSHYLEAAAEVGRSAALILEPGILIQQVVELIRERFNLYYVGLFLTDPTGEWAELRGGTGQAGQAMLARGHRIRLGDGMVGWSVEQSQARIALEAGEDAIRLATPELPETRSEAAIPLRSRGQTLGALSVQDSRPGAFDQDAIATLQTMADLVAVALDNAHLFEQSQQALESTRQAYGELTRAAWVEQIRARGDWGYCYEHRSLAPTKGDMGQEMKLAMLIEQSFTGKGSGGLTLAIPLRSREQVIGVLGFDKDPAADPWSTDEIAMMEALVEQLGLALENARLYQDTQQRAGRDQLVTEITSRFRGSLDIDSILQMAVREIGTTLDLAEVEVRLGSSPTTTASTYNDRGWKQSRADHLDKQVAGDHGGDA